MSLNLHRILIPETASEEQAYLFSLDQVHSLKGNVRSIEGEEFNYAGHCWSVVCSLKNNYIGLYLKLKNVSSCLSIRGKFGLSLVHQHNTEETITFSSSSQTFSNTNPFIGRSKFILLDDLLNASNGYLDSTGKRALIEVKMYESCTRFQIIIDTSSKGRHKKNPNGTYFDTNSFHFANHRWYLRFYLRKLNNNNLPAIYLYLQDGSPHSVSLQLQFILFLSSQATELLNYDFGDGARYDGFGKTLPCPIDNADRVAEMEVAVEIESLCVYKFVPLHAHRSSPTTIPTKATPIYSGTKSLSSRSSSPYNRSSTSSPYQRSSTSRSSSPHRISQLSESPNQIFQDHHGNQWRLNFSKETFLPSCINLCFDKGIYSYPNNNTTVAVIIVHIMSHDSQQPKDLHCNNNHPILTYFSNFTDDKGHLLNFPISFAELINPQNNYLNDNEEIVVRVDFLSVQSTKYSERSGPKFDSFFRLLYTIKQDSDDRSQDFSSSKEMSVSRASLSHYDDQPLSLSSASSGPGHISSPTEESRKNNNFSPTNIGQNNLTLSPNTGGPNNSFNRNNNRNSNTISPTFGRNNNLSRSNGRSNNPTPTITLSNAKQNGKAHSRPLSANSNGIMKAFTPNSSSKTSIKPSSFSTNPKASTHVSHSSNTPQSPSSNANDSNLSFANGISDEKIPTLMNGTCNNDTSTIHNNNNNFLKSLLHNLSKEQQTHNNTTNRQQHKTKSQHTYHRRPLKPPQAPTPAYNESMDELSLLRMSTSDPDLDLQHQQQVDKIVAVVKRKLPFHVSKVELMGSLGTNTTTPFHHDADVILVCADLPNAGKCTWMPSLMHALAEALKEEMDGWKDEKDGLKNDKNKRINELSISCITPTLFCVQIDLREGLELDVMLVGGEDGMVGLLEKGVKPQGELDEVQRWYEGEASLLRKKLYGEMDEQAKAYIKVLKRWVVSVEWRRIEYQPNNHLISLLTYKAYLLCENKSLFKVLQKINLLVQEPEMRISWDTSNNKDSIQFDPPTPLIIDPTNPTINVASSLEYWGQLRTELASWLTKMKLNLY